MVTDTMRVYVRNGTTPFAIVDSSKALLNGSGSGLFSLPGNSNNNQQYYIQLKHRNSIETWSIPFSFVNDTASYTFINSAAAAFGRNLIKVDNSPVRFAVYGGDVNQDGSIDVTDVVSVFNDANNFVSGYVLNDVTGDDFVDAADLVLTYNNSIEFVSKITP